jgi:iron transport multicopper oxidase
MNISDHVRISDSLYAKNSFTTRGRVALAFSCLSGILGVIIVAWYGLAPDPGAHAEVERRVAEAHVAETNMHDPIEAVKEPAGAEVAKTTTTGSGSSRT